MEAMVEDASIIGVKRWRMGEVRKADIVVPVRLDTHE